MPGFYFSLRRTLKWWSTIQNWRFASAGDAQMFSILHRSILSPAPIPSRSFKTVAAIAASGEDMTTVFTAVTVGSRSNSGKGADSNALDSTSLLSPATEKWICDLSRLQARATMRQAAGRKDSGAGPWWKHRGSRTLPRANSEMPPMRTKIYYLHWKLNRFEHSSNRRTFW